MESGRYYVLNPKAQSSKIPHATEDVALTEARRIAELEPDTEILVLKEVISVVYPKKLYTYKRYR
jgi:hypothetical protein